MAIVVTESDCEFLQNTYNPTGKVEMRVKSILLKLAQGYVELDKDLIKDVVIVGQEGTVTKTNNQIVLGALASEKYLPAPVTTGVDDEFFAFEDGKKYIPVLNENQKIPSKYIPATVITDVYPVANVKNWFDVFKQLEKEEIIPEKGDLIIISSSSNPDLLGSYFLKEDLSYILDEINNKGINESLDNVIINNFFEDHDPVLFVALTEPFGHLTTINLNGRSYTSESGVVNLPDVINVLLGDESIEISKEVIGDGLIGSKITLKQATQDLKGVVKISDTLEVSDDDVFAASVKLIKAVKEELSSIISGIDSRVSHLESYKETNLPAIKKGETLLNHEIDHNFGKFCDVSFYIKSTGEEVFVTVEKLENLVKIPSLKTDRDYEEGDLIVVIKP